MKPNDRREIVEPLAPLEPELRELLDVARRRDAEDPADETGSESLLRRIEATARATPDELDASEGSARTVAWLRPARTIAPLCLVALLTLLAIRGATKEGARDKPPRSQSSVEMAAPPEPPLSPPPSEAAEQPLIAAPIAESVAAPSSVHAPAQPNARPPSRAPAPPAAAAGGTSSASRSGASARGAGLAEEIRLIESARAAMTARDPKAALRLAREHERRFPTGQLTQQREWVRIQALGAMGAETEARERTEQFRKRFPSGLLLPSVERALDAGAP